MGLITIIIIGLIAGALAKAIMPGNDPGGIIVTILIGIVGAFVGHTIWNFLGGDGNYADFDIGSIILAVIGSLILLAGYRAVAGRRSTV